MIVMYDLQDKAKNVQLTVLTDRSQGGASIHDGEIELMVCIVFVFLMVFVIILSNSTSIDAN